MGYFTTNYIFIYKYMPDPFLLGPITSGAPFMIASVQGTNQPAILNTYPSENGTISYYWELSLDTLNGSTGIPVFSSSGVANNTTIIDSINGGGIGFDSDGVTIINVTDPRPINLSQTTFATWWPPDTFLSGIPYTILNGSGATGSIVSACTGCPPACTGCPTIPADNIVILPVNWYFNCTSSGQYNSITDPLASITSWYCVFDPSNDICSGVDTPSGGWTNLPDCQAGIVYRYCLNGKVCGDTNCNGPCSLIYYDCDSSSGNFTCKFDVTKYFEDTKWYETPYFIGSAVGLLVLIIIVMIVVFVLIRNTKEAREKL